MVNDDKKYIYKYKFYNKLIFFYLKLFFILSNIIKLFY